jgi:exopolyphosphatase/guanosine-5'-triphosphate,3'-diphosphate pyrophosphatase
VPTRRRVAAIDIGTNSVILLVVEADSGGVRTVVDKAVITRLGFGVDRTGRLDGAASERTLDCLQSFADELDQLGVTDRHVVGTSALRDAGDGEQFLSRAERALGVRPRVISGNDEAQLTFCGAISGLNLSEMVTVFDVGGGSTEIIAGRIGAREPEIARTISVDIGSVRLHERHVKRDPPQPEELLAVQRDIRAKLPESTQYRSSRSVIGVAGTVTTLFAISNRLATYDGDRVHGGRLNRAEVQYWSDTLARQTVAERRCIVGLEPKRADVIGIGALIVLELMDWLGKSEVIVSDRGVRWGLVEQSLRSERV